MGCSPHNVAQLVADLPRYHALEDTWGLEPAHAEEMDSQHEKDRSEGLDVGGGLGHRGWGLGPDPDPDPASVDSFEAQGGPQRERRGNDYYGDWEGMGAEGNRPCDW